MVNRRRWGWLVLLALASACNKGKDAPPTQPATDVAKSSPKVEGPTVQPTVTEAITFFVPKQAAWWGEMAFSCYSAAIRLQAGSTPSAPFDQVSPLVAPAMKAADIDLDRDVAAIGLWGCGDGACLYTALTLRHPEKLPDMLGVLLPGVQPKRVGKDVYTIDAPGAQGPRTIHLQAVPIAWPQALPTDAWSREAARATHVLFVTGLFGKSTEVDPIPMMADPATAAARVRDAEGVTADSHGMCVRGTVARRAFQPGFQLDHARFALVAPEGKPDALARTMGVERTLALDVELALDPAPTAPVVDHWIADAEQWLAQITSAVRAQFGTGSPLVDAILEVAKLIGTKGFHHDIKDKVLVLSWRTDRITSADLASVEVRLEAAMKAAPSSAE